MLKGAKFCLIIGQCAKDVFTEKSFSFHQQMSRDNVVNFRDIF